MMAANRVNEVKLQCYSMNNKENEFELKLYPLDENEYIGTIWLDKGEISNSIQTLILLDSSNSMGDSTRRFVNEIIPLVMTKLSYGRHPVHLITFGKETTHNKLFAEQMKTLQLFTGNETRMAPAIQKLNSIIRRFHPNKPIRIFSISDGIIGDRDEVNFSNSLIVKTQILIF